MRAGIHVHEHALRGHALRTVAGDGIAVIEVAHLADIEADALILAVQADRNAVAIDLLDCGEVTIGDAEFARRRRELNAIAFGEVPPDLLVGTHALQTLRIIGDLAAVLPTDGEAIGVCVDAV